MVTNRETDRRNPIETTFDHDPHRTGIVHIGSGIVTMVDSTNNQVRLPVEYLIPCQFYAVGRCTGTFINSQSHIFL